jgi:KaiC/GvpD/RAD55 family RecA-like ATPase
VLIVATGPHRNDLVKELREVGLNVRQYAREGRFRMFDAGETLESFMLNGRPDPALFNQSIGNLLAEARKNSRGKNQDLTVFGEMVAVLWERGEKEAALELEGLWNQILNRNAFHLHCAYPRSNFVKDEDQIGLTAVCHAHSHVLA